MNDIENNLCLNTTSWRHSDERASISQRMAFHTTPGLSAAVIDDGEITWVKCFGIKESGKKESVTPETIFQACSISKSVAMVGVLKLVQDGLLDLDEDVNHYLKTWKIPDNMGWQPVITLRQLLGHNAGLTKNWYRGYENGKPIPSLLQVLDGLSPANTPPVRVTIIPESQFCYSGSNYSVIQQLLWDVTQEPFPELMRSIIFGPLGMRHSSFDQSFPFSQQGNTASGHYIGGKPIFGKWRILPEMAAAGLWTTASDLAKFTCAIQNACMGLNDHFLSKSTIDHALQSQTTLDYGLGLSIERKGERLIFGHDGDNIGYKCLFRAYTYDGKGAVIMTNGDDGYLLAKELLFAIADTYQWPYYLPMTEPSDQFKSQLSSFEGTYNIRDDMFIRIVISEEKLNLVLPGQPKIEFIHVEENLFRSKFVSSELKFNYEKSGNIKYLIIRQDEKEIILKKLVNAPPVLL